MSDSPRVGVVVVNWRRPEATRAACRRSRQADVSATGSPSSVDNGCRRLRPRCTARRSAQAPHTCAAPTTSVSPAARISACTRRWRTAPTGCGFSTTMPRRSPPRSPSCSRRRPARRVRRCSSAKILRCDRPERIDSIALDLDLVSGRVLPARPRRDRPRPVRRRPRAARRHRLRHAGPARRLRASGRIRRQLLRLYGGRRPLPARPRRRLRVAVAPRARVRHDRAPATSGRQSTSSLYYACRNHLRVLATHAPQAGWRSRCAPHRSWRATSPSPCAAIPPAPPSASPPYAAAHATISPASPAPCRNPWRAPRRRRLYGPSGGGRLARPARVAGVVPGCAARTGRARARLHREPAIAFASHEPAL